MTVKELWNERTIRRQLRDLKETRVECEPLTFDEYFWFSYSNQGQEGPMFKYFSQNYEIAIDAMRNSINQAESVLESLASQSHSEERLEMLREKLLPYQEHIKKFSEARLYVNFLQSNLDSTTRHHFQRGQQQKEFDAQIAELGIYDN